VWFYAAACVVLAAWVSPVFYNAGKALAEVCAHKATNGPLDWVAGHCREADFRQFYLLGLWFAALLLFLPWMEWLHARRDESPSGGGGPWGLRIPRSSCLSGGGQRLWNNLRGPWHAFAGFLLVGGLMLPMGVALVPAGFFSMQPPGGGFLPLALRVLLWSGLLALVMELFFRGVAMGVFLRAMAPATAIGMSAAYFALVISMIPPPGMDVADPEAAGIGFELLRKLLARFGDWREVLTGITPLLALGVVLAYARWRTASLWLPAGLHTGWLFARGMLAELSSTGAATNPAVVEAGGILQQSLIPMAAIILAGIFAHFLTAEPDDERAIFS
jgi:membrane protease YdiL (CAAX protease family)